MAQAQRTQKRLTKAEALLRQEREQYSIPEVAPAFAETLSITEAGARSRLYQAVYSGRVAARSYLGSVRIPHHEAERILRGEEM